MKIETRKQCGSVLVRVVQGDITRLDERQDCLVSSDDNHLTHGGGVSRDIWRAAGPSIEMAARQHVGSLRLGDVVSTGAGSLNAGHILHAVTIDFDTRQLLGRAEARDLFAEVLNTARRLGCTSLATPLLGTGAGNLDARDFMDAALDVLVDFLDAPGSLREISFVGLGDAIATAKAATEQHLVGWVPIQLLLEKALRAVPDGLEFDEMASLTGTADMEQPVVMLRAFDMAIDLLIRFVQPTPPAQEALARVHGALGTRLQQLLRLRSDAGRPIPQETAAALESFIGQRNRLVHGMGPAVSANLMGLLWRGMREALSLLAAETPQNATTGKRGRSRSDPTHRRPHGEPPNQSTPQCEKTTPPREVDSGTEPVRKLHKFLMATLQEAELGELLQFLHKEGYQGSKSNQVLEYCVRVPDPAELLSENYTPPSLRDKIKAQGYRESPPGTPMQELINNLLQEMGFSRSEDAVSLQAQIKEITDARSRVHSSSPSELFGIVSQVAKRLEHCLKILIYALANAAFHMPAEQLVKERRWLDTSKELEKASLGALLDIVLKIDTAFREGGGVQGFRDDFTIVCLLPDDIRDRCQKIPALRNSFTHVTKSPHPPETPQQRSLRFFNEVVALLECLRDRKTSLGEKISLFPIVIRVVGLHFDEYGRKTVTAVTDGRTNETLFTVTDIKPGQIYFMYPLTNPHRIDPILHPAGYLGRMMGMD